MRKIFYFLLSTILLGSCNTSKDDGNFIVTGKVIGLKKGTLYLEKITNNKITTIDSIYINDATEAFTFTNQIKEPEIYLISLDKLEEKQISFFGEPGKTHITTYLDNFYVKRKISGSLLQELLEQHDAYTSKINNKNLDLIKDKFEAQKYGDFKVVKEIENKRLYNLKKSYLFSANYAIAHKDKAIAPFIAISRMQSATPKLKQKIYDALTPEIKNSKYGLQLKKSLN